MRTKKTLGIVLIILGAAFILTSFYIKAQVKDGRQQIAEGQKTVKTGEKILSVTPVTEEVGNGLFSSAKNQISDGIKQANFYDSLATWLQIGGIVFIVLGAVFIFIGRKKYN